MASNRYIKEKGRDQGHPASNSRLELNRSLPGGGRGEVQPHPTVNIG